MTTPDYLSDNCQTRLWLNLRQQRPLVHCLTNYVSMPLVANALLAVGASPVMARAEEEVGEIVRRAAAVVLNIGTPESSTVCAMKIAARTAAEVGVPVVFDPVGVGATAFRKDLVKDLLNICRPTIIRGNASEIRALPGLHTAAAGVDACQNETDVEVLAVQLSQHLGAVVVASGETDIVTDGQNTLHLFGGHDLMRRVTGTGCAATAIIAACAAVEPDAFKAATIAARLMKQAGEAAAKTAKGPGSFAVNLLDELERLTSL